MIGKIKITLRDQPGVYAPGYELILHAPGDPIPSGMLVTEILTDRRHYLVGENQSRNQVVQKIAYNRHRLKLFARPSDNLALLSSGRNFEILLPDGTIHIAELIEFSDEPAGSINARMIDIDYIDINSDNYGQEPVNNYLTNSALKAKITAGTLANAQTVRLGHIVPIVSSEVFYTALKPVDTLSDAVFAETDTVKGIARQNTTAVQQMLDCTFYFNEADKKLFLTKLVTEGHVSNVVYRLVVGSAVYTSVEVPRFEVSEIGEGASLYQIRVFFKYQSHYVYNY